jgi:hypothetical protein
LDNHGRVAQMVLLRGGRAPERVVEGLEPRFGGLLLFCGSACCAGCFGIRCCSVLVTHVSLHHTYSFGRTDGLSRWLCVHNAMRQRMALWVYQC